MTSLAWRPAQRDDRVLLESFICTQRPRRVPMRKWPVAEREWEQRLQGDIRKASVPGSDTDIMLLGMDGDQLAAVSFSSAQQEPVIKMCALAVALRYRKQDRSCADDAIVQTMLAALDYAVSNNWPSLQLVGWLDPRNNASRHLCVRHEFTRLPEDANGYEQWARAFNLT